MWARLSLVTGEFCFISHLLIYFQSAVLSNRLMDILSACLKIFIFPC